MNKKKRSRRAYLAIRSLYKDKDTDLKYASYDPGPFSDLLKDYRNSQGKYVPIFTSHDNTDDGKEGAGMTSEGLQKLKKSSRKKQKRSSEED